MHSIRFILLTIACLVISLTPVWAVTRTTPVEVMNALLVGIDPGNNTVQAVQRDPWYVGIMGTPNFNIANSPTVKIDATTNTVKIDATTNTVKAAQSGTWSVGVSTMPTVSVNTHAVTQSGTWNVGINNTPDVNIANTPSVSVSNSPTVKIDSTANSVVAASKHNTIQLWATDQSVATQTYLYSPTIDCAGYNELRVMLWSTVLSANVLVYVSFRSPTGSFMTAKSTSWAGSGSILSFACPVYGDTCRIEIYNATASSLSIIRHSYVYLVN